MASKKVTLARIAEQLGVSKITVSRALKGQPGVSETLRRETRGLAFELGFKYERLRSPRKGKGRFIFLVSKRFYLANDVFYHEIYYHLNSLCLTGNFELSVWILEKDVESRRLLPEDAGSADGIFIGGEVSEAVMREISTLHLPCVAIDFNIISGSISCVIIDNYLVGVIAAEYLYRQGYRKIGFIGSSSRTSSAFDRIHGFMKVMEQKKLQFRNDWFINNFDEQNDTYILNVPLPDELPEAFICYNDDTAYYFIEKLKSSGYRVPEDTAILSIDNTGLAASCTPPLTSINIDRRGFAKEALGLMMERLKGNTTVQRMYLNIDIVERDSVPVKNGPRQPENMALST
jgi:LacI family transcriptional regulator